jgi:hypothetical protein
MFMDYVLRRRVADGTTRKSEAIFSTWPPARESAGSEEVKRCGVWQARALAEQSVK